MEPAAFDDLDPECRRVVGVYDRPVVHVVRRAVVRPLYVLELRVVRVELPEGRQAGHGGGTLDPRESTDALERVHVEPPDVRGARVIRFGETHLHREQVVGIEHELDLP